MTIRDAVRPIYMPPALRILAVTAGLIVAAAPLTHMFAHVWLQLHGGAPVESGSDWPKVVLIVVGLGVGFPDPIIGMILAWRRRRAEKGDTEEREAKP